MWRNKYGLQIANIWGCQVIISWTLVFYIYTQICTISKDIGINKEKELCLPNKEAISSYGCERTNMASKYEL